MTIDRRQALCALAAAAALSYRNVHAAQATLKEAAASRGLRVGNAMAHAPDRFGNAAYRALTARQCGVIVCENETKWQALQPRPGAYDFAAADAMFAWAGREGLQRRGHTLVWQPGKWLPAWIESHDFGARPAAGAERLLATHIRTVTEHFGRDVYSWDVVNEAVDPADGALRANAFTRRLGAIDQIDLCFRLARTHAPHAQLVYNDYMRGDAGSAKHRAGVLKLLEALKAKGTPVDAVGLQSHIGSWDDVRDGKDAGREWRRFLDAVTGMGYRLLITEFDVNDRELPGDIARRDAGVAALAKDYLDLTLSYPQVTDFVMWGMADHVSWLRTWDEAPRKDGLTMRGTPYDEALRPKPLFDAILAALRAMPPRAA
ncbi:endo-1,4-beta-xylanase [Pseudoduganella buxea]|uniref:Beta-xylanase n=1 Tax=Pseudoduganella buxea TaxID=1949069 RepID=A0A6I3T4Y5_9BURK|nr:endo-1,4-beta-xylanase [Pseudoduganella buxea]MTV55995.1 hypothetical protein [Pseudoduganella buxea]GGC17708.1 beta-xylanase [Pseudoduganella buxea]